MVLGPWGPWDPWSKAPGAPWPKPPTVRQSYLLSGKATYCQASKDSQASTQPFHRLAPNIRILCTQPFPLKCTQNPHSCTQEFPHTCTQKCPHTGCDFIMKSKGLQKFVYEQYMQCRFGLDFPSHLQARISDMFSPYLVDWENINFSASLDACKALHIGNSMKIIKTWLNGWHSSSRCQAAQPFPLSFWLSWGSG